MQNPRPLPPPPASAATLGAVDAAPPIIKETLAHGLLAWFDAQGRALPWREARTPYHALVAEVMLQQTQVVSALPYYQRWLARFPTVQALAEAPLDEVLKQWEGLGYYRRARHLHRAARRIAERGGRFPESYEGWLELPGVGPYTAAALASMLSRERVLAVDGNVKRLAARLFALEGEVTAERARSALAPQLDGARPGDFNEALMDLGATVCTPKAPKCSSCPLSASCLAFRTGRVRELPTPKAKPARPHRERYAVIDLQDGHVWLRQRPPEEMLSGLWGFALVESPPANARAVAPVTHAYTHFSTTVTPVVMTSAGLEGRFVPLAEVERLALSALDRKILAALCAAGILGP